MEGQPLKKVAFDYHLKITFDEPVTRHRFTIRCFPVSDERQEILEMNTSIYPNRFLEQTVDSFGNRCVYGMQEDSHQLFEVRVSGTALLGKEVYTKAPEDFKVGLFRAVSKYTHMGSELMQLYRSIPVAESNLERSRNIMKAVHDSLEYCPGSTNINTLAEEALKERKGVCQDYAHIMLALCRQARIPCRYVVGMLTGEGASHAWVEIYDNERWYGLDPTNLIEVTDSHVKISHGRDYEDCILNIGTFMGNTKQHQEVSVKVEEIQEK